VTGTMHMTAARRYGIVFAAICLIFIAANIAHFLRPVTCWDCFFPYGVPFTLYQQGGEGGGAGISWRGLAKNIGVLVIAALLIVKLCSVLMTRHKQQRRC
jgi:hypothetical protein